jgi:hypothetical protein
MPRKQPQLEAPLPTTDNSQEPTEPATGTTDCIEYIGTAFIKDSPPLTPFRAFIATAPLKQIILILTQMGKFQGDPWLMKMPYAVWDGDAYCEVYGSGGDTINLKIQRGKSKFDNAKLQFSKVEEELRFARGQVRKIQHSVNMGDEGRLNDLLKYQQMETQLCADLNDFQAIIDNPDIETYSFKLEECV